MTAEQKPWTCSWSMVGRWLVQTGDRDGEPYSGQLSFHEADEAKARLIAAGPDMLAALTEIATFWDHLHPDARPEDALVEIARAAIAQAEGRS